MRLEEIESRFGGEFHGDVSVSLQSKLCRSMVKTVMKEPTIRKTPVGVRLETKDNRVDIDFRKATEKESATDLDCSVEYEDAGMVMSIAFILASA